MIQFLMDHAYLIAKSFATIFYISILYTILKNIRLKKLNKFDSYSISLERSFITTSFVMLLVLIFMIGIIYEQPIQLGNAFFRQLSYTFFAALTASIKVLLGEFRVELIASALENDSWYLILFWLSSFNTFTYFIYSIALVIKDYMNDFLAFLRRHKNTMIVIGNPERIQVFLDSVAKKLNIEGERTIDKFKSVKKRPKRFYFKMRNLLVKRSRRTKIDPLETYSFVLVFEGVSNVLRTHELIKSNMSFIYKYTVFGEIDLFRITPIKQSSPSKFIKKYFNKWFDLQNQTIKIISLMEKDSDNIQLLVEFSKLLKAYEQKSIEKPHEITMTIGYDDMDKPDLYHLFEKNEGRIDFYSYHRILAHDFVMSNPITKATMKNKDAKLNYFLIGFGHTNRQILKHLLVNNQVSFLEDTKYFVYANNVKETWDHFLHGISYMRFNKDIEKNYFDDVKFREEIEAVTYKNVDMMTKAFLDELDIVDYKKRINHFIIATGQDIHNIETAHILSKYIKQKKIDQYTEIFIVTSDSELDAKNIFKTDNIKSIGMLKDIFTYDHMIGTHINDLAMWTNWFFSTNIRNHQYDPNKEREKCLELWQKATFYHRLSSQYAALAIRNKLNLLGLDLIKGNKGINDEEYYQVYDDANQRLTWKPVDDEHMLNRYFEDTLRNRLAYLEKQRWNYYMLMDGYIPFAKEDILERYHCLEKKMNSEMNNQNLFKLMMKASRLQIDEEEKRHACLTTHEGLRDVYRYFNNLITTYDSVHKVADYFIADYEQMDFLPIILRNSGYVIVKL